MKSIRNIIVLSCLLCAGFAAQCQEVDSVEIYRKQYTELNKIYAKAPHDIANLVEMARFYASDRNPMRSLPLAMTFVCTAETDFSDLINGEKYNEARKLIRKGVDLPAIRNLKHAIAVKAQEELTTGRTYSLVEIDAFEKAFASDPTVSHTVKTMRMEQSLSDARSDQDINKLYTVIVNFPGTSEAEKADVELAKKLSGIISSKNTFADIDAIATEYSKSESLQRLALQRKAHLAYLQTKQANTVEAYKTYLSNYPSGDDYISALESLDELLADKYAALRTPQEYIDFIDSNRTSSLAEQATDHLRNSILQDHDVIAARLFLQHFPHDIQYNDVYQFYYNCHACEGNRQPIEAFVQRNSDYPSPEQVQADMSRAARIDAFNLNQPFNNKNQKAYTSFIRQNAGKGISFVALQRMLQPSCAQKDWNGALALIDANASSFTNASKAELESLKAILSTDPDPRTLRRNVMNANYDMLHPTQSPDGTKLFFTQVTESGKNICYAQYFAGKHGGWRFMGTVAFINIENKDTEIFGFFDNGNKMLLGQQGDIMIAEYDSNVWRVSEILPYPINTDYLESDAYMVPDGSGILFVSDRPDGFNVQQSFANFHGDTAAATDIYFAPRTAYGWGKPINLGCKINSIFCERSPLLSKDLQTLYFITDGKGGMGYGDIYSATRKNLDTWTEWENPVNLGREANTSFDEASISFSPDESKIHIVSNNLGGHYACYSIASLHSSLNNFKDLHIDCSECTPINLSIVDLADTSIAFSIRYPNPDSGIDFTCNKDHSYMAFCTYTDIYTPPVEIKGTKHKLSSCGYQEQVSQDSAILSLPTLAFADSSDNLTMLAKITLDNLMDYLSQVPSKKAVISLNHDGDDDATSFSITQRQSKAIKAYLKSKGFDTTKIVVATYGNVKYRKGLAPKTPVTLKFESRHK